MKEHTENMSGNDAISVILCTLVAAALGGYLLIGTEQLIMAHTGTTENIAEKGFFIMFVAAIIGGYNLGTVHYHKKKANMLGFGIRLGFGTGLLASLLTAIALNGNRVYIINALVMLVFTGLVFLVSTFDQTSEVD